MPVVALYAHETGVGFFVKKELSARGARAYGAGYGTIKGGLSCGIAAPAVAPTPAGKPPPAKAAKEPEVKLPARFESGPYRWVPAWPEKLDGDEVTFNKKRSHRIVLYDPLPRGVGPLDQTRVVVDPSIALKMLEAFALSDAAKAQGAAEGAPPAPAPPPPASSSAPEKKAVAFPDEVDLTQWV